MTLEALEVLEKSTARIEWSCTLVVVVRQSFAAMGYGVCVNALQIDDQATMYVNFRRFKAIRPGSDSILPFITKFATLGMPGQYSLASEQSSNNIDDYCLI